MMDVHPATRNVMAVAAAPANIAAGPYTLVASVSFQACNGNICLPARAMPLETSVVIIK